MSGTVKYVGLDVHKITIAVAVAEDGRRAEVCEHGEIANTPSALTKLLGKLGGPGVELHICYEAGPCGYGIQRQVAAAGHNCVVVAPSLIPSRPGDRIKTDRRDAMKLARLHRAGELTSVWIPDSAHEAMRDLVRARLAAVRSLRHARQQLYRISAPSRPSLSPPRMAPDASSLAVGASLCRRRTSYRAGGQYRDGRCRQGAPRPADGTDREAAGRLDPGTGGRGFAGASRDGAGCSGDHRRRTGRHQQVCKGRAADVLSRAGAVGGLQREAASAGRHHQGGQRRGGC